METRVAEVAEDILQLSTYVDEADFTFNQYLVRAEEPLLFHTGPRQMFPLVQDAVASVLPVETVRWVVVRPSRGRRVRVDEPVARGRARGRPSRTPRSA